MNLRQTEPHYLIRRGQRFIVRPRLDAPENVRRFVGATVEAVRNRGIAGISEPRKLDVATRLVANLGDNRPSAGMQMPPLWMDELAPLEEESA